MSKLRGQVKATGYPQTEGLLGDCMLKYGRELGEDSAFGGYLCPSCHSGDTSWVGCRTQSRYLCNLIVLSIIRVVFSLQGFLENIGK